MELNFRQGIVQLQPLALSLSSNKISLNCDNVPAKFAMADRNNNYLISFEDTQRDVWDVSTVPSLSTAWLYIDIAMRDAKLTFGYTTIDPTSAFGIEFPEAPETNQHYFRIDKGSMYVYSNRWREVIRVFVGKISSSSNLTQIAAGSQVNLQQKNNAGTILRDVNGAAVKPAGSLISGGNFVTTVTDLYINDDYVNSLKPEFNTPVLISSDTIPKAYCVGLGPTRREGTLASSTNSIEAIGLSANLASRGEKVSISTHGLYRNDSWNFSDNDVGKPVFVGPSGEIVVNLPKNSFSVQKMGAVFSSNQIFLNIQSPIFLNSTLMLPECPVPPE